MFAHNFKYAFKTLLRERMLIFWTFAFPLIMATFFQMAFSNIENSESFDVIPIAVVDNEEFQSHPVVKEALASLGDKQNKERMFDIHYGTEKEAGQLLEDGEIIGYLLMQGESHKVVVATSGVSETIFKSVVEEIVQTADMVETVAGERLAAGSPELFLADGTVNAQQLEQLCYETAASIQEQEVSLKDVSRANLSYTMIEFYTLIAMTCLYGGIIGMTAINYSLANMSSNGKRVSVSPAGKGTIVLSSMLAGYVIHLMGVALLFLYTTLILKVDYGENLPLVVLLACVGCLAGLSIGIAVGALLKASENAKIGIVIAVSMAGCFLSGMMGITMKYIVDSNIPFVNAVNPAAMITDGLYALYYYDAGKRYVLDLVSLLVFTAVMLLLSFRSLRRERYDSI